MTRFKKILFWAIFTLISLGIMACEPAEATEPEPTAEVAIGLEPVAQNLDSPLLVTHAGDSRLFVLERGGKIKLIQDGRVLPEPFLDVSERITAGGERGLLGLAFDPNYSKTGHFYVNYTDTEGDTVVARFTVSEIPNKADANSETILLSAEQPYGNHNGGHLAFGPDGMLYIGAGDGGSGGDPENNGQRLDTLLGKILRLDVSGERYTIPPDNPFVNDESALNEIWAYGLRNPWRFSFDRDTGDLFIGDVGQGLREEINYQSADSAGGENYGWNVVEGDLCYPQSTQCDLAAYTAPILTYDHDTGVSVTGGYVYRGEALSELKGAYLYGDYGTGTVWAARQDGTSWSSEVALIGEGGLASFGEDAAGELYVVYLNAGSVLRVTAD